MKKDFYVYTLAKPDGTVFYVGKGTTRKVGDKVFDRIDDHEKEARFSLSEIKRRRFNYEKCKTIQDIWAQGGQVLKQKVYTTGVELNAYIYEWILIHLIYGIDHLTNKSKYGINYSLPETDTPDHSKTSTSSEEMISLAKAGKILGVSSATVLNIIKAGKLPGYRIASEAWRVRRGDVEAYLEAIRYKPHVQETSHLYYGK
ncbi:LEM-3-like GIY-YIG domain-containing protein [Ktedonobacter racemifer]|uniref:DNA binding domain protein, excisionase family n=1 Tax=Ktedonobacter racemifer DSM 44963 TaxID=485913 RepID=D6THE5_KTERA|nr:helix-turn-helix domain-containing protein [Ktedonobacter racemifer]EFH88950.1 DNA binding domain protein, excisionase family [Ktedonobacter racemifer DSM 44963]